jgi:leishmanolysin
VVICTADDVLTSEKLDTLVNVILPNAVQFIQSALKVIALTTPLNVGHVPCQKEITSPPAHSDPGVSDADFVLYVTAGPMLPTQQTTLAWASSCSYDSVGRPIVGHANFNPAKLSGVVSSYAIKIATHELFHALGFSDGFARTKFLPPNDDPIRSVMVRGKHTTGVFTPEVVARAREYYGCSNMTYLELEDQGGSGTSGTHWEKRVLLNELMVGYFTGGEVTRSVSPMTLAYFKDSGHYDVDYSKADDPSELWFGRNAGCGFLSDKCNASSPFFCFTPGTIACSPDRLSVAFCNVASYQIALPTQFQYPPLSANQGSSVIYTDYCPFYEGYGNLICPNVNQVVSAANIHNAQYFHENSRCFDTTDNDGTIRTGGLRKSSPMYYSTKGQRCFRSRCLPGPRIELMIGDYAEWLPCPLDGTAGSIPAPQGYYGRIICPAAAEFCTAKLFEGPSSAVPSVLPLPSGPVYLPTPTVSPMPKMPGPSLAFVRLTRSTEFESTPSDVSGTPSEYLTVFFLLPLQSALNRRDISLEILHVNTETKIVRFRFIFGAPGGPEDVIPTLRAIKENIRILPYCDPKLYCASHGTSMNNENSTQCVCTCANYWYGPNCTLCGAIFVQSNCSVGSPQPPPSGIHIIQINNSILTASIAGTIGFLLVMAVAIACAMHYNWLGRPPSVILPQDIVVVAPTPATARPVSTTTSRADNAV